MYFNPVGCFLPYMQQIKRNFKNNRTNIKIQFGSTVSGKSQATCASSKETRVNQMGILALERSYGSWTQLPTATKVRFMPLCSMVYLFIVNEGVPGKIFLKQHSQKIIIILSYLVEHKIIINYRCVPPSFRISVCLDTRQSTRRCTSAHNSLLITRGLQNEKFSQCSSNQQESKIYISI